MHQYHLNNVDHANFLSHYWQKQPCVIRQGFNDFNDPVDEHDLAGLAMENYVDSRIISQSDQRWNITQGPFEQFETLCVDKWSLLVQGIDKYIADAQPLMNAFHFLPVWRTDDLMASFSVSGAGVGPHLDQYDVFIVQGKGSRRWQVGSRGEHQQVYPHPRLRQVAMFEPLIDEVLYPGDIIYIPPGFPHNGVALEECLNYSVGFRAPSQQELLSSLADYALQTDSFNHRYSDPDILPRQSPIQILNSEIESFRHLMTAALNGPDFEIFLLNHLSQADAVDTAQKIDTYTQAQIFTLLDDGASFYPAAGIKPVYQQPQGDSFTFHVEGQVFSLPRECQKLMINLLDQPCFRAEKIDKSHKWLEFVQMLTILVNAGFWFPA